MKNQRTRSTNVPKPMQDTFEGLTALTDAFCQEWLNQEYAELAREAAAALCRKRPSPVARGRLSTWACGIVYALGSVNFLFDKSGDLYVSAADLCSAFQVASSTGASKAKEVRDALKMRPLDVAWCLPSQVDSHPTAWFVEVDGIIIDARQLPRHWQEVAYRKGLIPYLPPPPTQDRG